MSISIWGVILLPVKRGLEQMSHLIKTLQKDKQVDIFCDDVHFNWLIGGLGPGGLDS